MLRPFTILACLLLMLSLVTCKLEDLTKLPEVELEQLDNQLDAVNLTAQINVPDYPVSQVGFLWGTGRELETEIGRITLPISQIQEDKFQATVADLRLGSVYFFRAFVQIDEGLIYSPPVEQHTTNIELLSIYLQNTLSEQPYYYKLSSSLTVFDPQFTPSKVGHCIIEKDQELSSEQIQELSETVDIYHPDPDWPPSELEILDGTKYRFEENIAFSPEHTYIWKPYAVYNGSVYYGKPEHLSTFGKGAWIPQQSVPDVDGIAESVGLSVNGKGYIITGLVRKGSQQFRSSRVYEFDPQAEIGQQWQEKRAFPGEARFAATGFTIGDKLYVGTGRGATDRQDFVDFYAYDPLADSWTEVSAIVLPEDTPTDAEERARYNTVGLSLNGKGYVISGRYWDETQYQYEISGQTYEFDPEFGLQGRWRRMEHMGSALDDAVGMVLNDHIYVGTGNLPDRETNLFRVFDPLGGVAGSDNIGKWSVGPIFQGSNRTGASAFTINGKAYICFGGSSDYPKYADIWQFDGSRWTYLKSYNSHKRFEAASFVIGDRAYIVGGYAEVQDPNSGQLVERSVNDVWEFIPEE